MTTLSIAIPNDMAKESQHVVKKLGVSRTDFIRQAIQHELEQFHKQLSEAVARAFVAMKSDKNYRAKAEAIMNHLSRALSINLYT